MLTRRLRAADDADDAGMTLTELLVGMSLLLIVATLATSFLISTSTQANRVTDQSLIGGSARAAMTQIAATLRVADTADSDAGDSDNRFVTISPAEITFYSNISSSNRSGTNTRTAPSKVDFTLTAGKLTESVYNPTSSVAPATYPSTPTSRNVLVTGVTNTTVFTYCSDTTDPSVTCTATTDPDAVSMVQVTLTVGGLAGSTPQTLQSGIAVTGALT